MRSIVTLSLASVVLMGLLSCSNTPSSKVDAPNEQVRNMVIKYYNKQGEWAEVFTMDFIEKMKIKTVNENKSYVHVRYHYIPVPHNRKGRTDSGYDQRIFTLVNTDNDWGVINMSGYMSADF